MTDQAVQAADAAKALEEQRAPNVVAALLRVMRDLPAIGKDQRADPKQGGYAYRGIEQITAAAQPLFARHGVLFTAHGLTFHETRDITVNGKPWTDTIVEVTYRVYGPGGVEDFIDVGPIPAVGRDNSDKGANKCMTQAFKYALIQSLCIADPNDDADGTTNEGDAPPAPVELARLEVRQAIADRIKALPGELRSELAAQWADLIGVPDSTPAKLLPAEVGRAEQIVADYEARAMGEAQAQADEGGAQADPGRLTRDELERRTREHLCLKCGGTLTKTGARAESKSHPGYHGTPDCEPF